VNPYDPDTERDLFDAWARAASPEEEPGEQAGEKAEKKSAATVLLDIAESIYGFGVSDGGEAYGVPRDGAKVVLLLRGGKASLRAQLAREYRRRTGKVAPQQALADALLTIEGIAQEQDGEATLYQRVARHGGALWLDVGDLTGRAIRITAAGWSIQDRAPVLFKRTALNSPLPVPVPGADLDELWSWLNVTPEDRPLVAAWLVSALHDAMPHPILGLFGEQGTGKTTAAKVLVMTLDPGPVPARKPPKDADSWVTAAQGSWVVGLDNLSDMPGWLSDSLCRAVTGDGDVRRKLYTDGELAVFAYRRALVVTGIDLGALNGDLADRLLSINLEIIPDRDRLEEDELWPAWAKAHPRILGAVLDLAAGVAGVLPSVRLGSKPRMADYARVLAAVDRVLGTEGLARYVAKQRTLATDSLTGDPFITAIAETVVDTFTGTAAELLTLVTPTDEKWRAPKGWPGTARAVTQRLRRQAPPMRKAGWVATGDDGANHDKTIRWTITPPREAPNPDPQDPQDPQNGDHGGSAGHAGQESGPSQDAQPDAVYPKRVQVSKLEGAVLIPPGATYVGRNMPGIPTGHRSVMTQFGNPHKVGGTRGSWCSSANCAAVQKVHDRAEAIELYREHLHANPQLVTAARGLLAGRDLACWCPLDLPCHADVLLRIANGGTP
jgi:hypothetical protein